MKTKYKHIISEINFAFKIIKHIDKINFKSKQNNEFKQVSTNTFLNSFNSYINTVNLFIKYYLNNFNINLYWQYINTLSDRLIEVFEQI